MCAMSEDDDARLNKANKKTTCTLTCQVVAFHVHCVGLGCHVVIGVGRLVVLCHHACKPIPTRRKHEPNTEKEGLISLLSRWLKPKWLEPKWLRISLSLSSLYLSLSLLSLFSLSSLSSLFFFFEIAPSPRSRSRVKQNLRTKSSPHSYLSLQTVKKKT